jgi:N6-L-threonylcarbamoyladenine synthase
MNKKITILGIESSCDETSAAIMKDGVIYSNLIAGQKIHEAYGGVVPELASRAHQKNIVPVISQAISQAGIALSDIDAIAYTRGPGLLGSLIVGTCFAKGMSLGLNIPLIEVNHMHGHILAHFIKEKDTLNLHPKFPFLCLTVSGGHTQIVLVRDYFDMQIIGQTIDDAAGEAFDKIAKILGFPYPGGPLIDKYAASGDSTKFKFVHPKVQDLDYSFSGLKTSFLNFIKNNIAENSDFIEQNKADLCACIQKTIVDILFDKLLKAAEQTGIKEIAIAGGVSANTGLRAKLNQIKDEFNFNVYIPKFEYCTDNAAMIAMVGYLKYLKNDFSSQSNAPLARYAF